MTIPLTIIINLVLSVAVVSAILTLLVWSIATQYRDNQTASVVRLRGHAQPPNRIAAASTPSSEHRAAA